MIDQVFKGAKDAAAIVCSTMGPLGRKVAIMDSKRNQWVQRFTRDGVTVAKHLAEQHINAAEGIGRKALLDAANKTVKAAGDGTTTTCCIAASLLSTQPKGVIEYLKKNIEWCLNYIDEMADDYPLTKELLIEMAITSANNNVEIGTMIGEMIWELGGQSFVQGKPSPDGRTFTEIRKGYELGSGVILPQFLGPNNSITLENPYVLLIQEKVSEYQDLVPVYQQFQKLSLVHGQYKRPLVIVGPNIENNALRFVISNLLSPKEGQVPVPVFVIKVEGNDQEQLKIMEDLKVAVGAGAVYTKYTGEPLKNFKATGFGHCDAIELSVSNARFLTSKEFEQDCVNRAASIEGDDDFSKARRSKLTKGVGLIYVGGYTDTESNYINDVVEDCVLACQAAMDSGIVPGCAFATSQLAEALPNGEGFLVLQQAMKAPFEQICENAGITATPSEGYCYDVVRGQYLRPDENNVWDCAKVVKEAIKNAVSMACELMETKHVILE